MTKEHFYAQVRAVAPAICLYESSATRAGDTQLVMGGLGCEELLVAGGSGALFAELSGRLSGGVKLCPRSHANRLAVNRHLPHTAPAAVLAHPATFGFGDRLGIAGGSHLSSLRNTDVLPVLAQQSMRELALTGRTYADVIDAAAWAVLQHGWTKGYGADGDHLKTAEEIAAALAAGCTMVTLDVSDALRPAPRGEAALHKAYLQIPAHTRARYEATYLKGSWPAAFRAESLMAAAVTCGGAVKQAKELWHAHIAAAGRPVDFELSLDETAETTPPATHCFVAHELALCGVRLASLAPRFVGEFQKGIDYIGDVDEFTAHLRAHCAVADHFGHKISVHSGSDKFAVFEAVGRETHGRFHLKTSGTSWLEAVRLIAWRAPALYRKLHASAEQHFAEASRYYAVHCDPTRVAPLCQTGDATLPDYLDTPDGRQLLHIAYGAILREEPLKTELYAALCRHAADYDAGLRAHMLRHLRGLGAAR